MSYKIFEEKQRFNQWWIWVFLALFAVILGFDFFEGDQPFQLDAFILSFGVFILMSLFLFSITLKTRIDEIGVHIKMFPFHFSYKTYRWENLYSVEALKYSPLGDYGGWGLRISFRGKGKAFSVKGNNGIRVQTADGKTRMIGTQKEAEANEVIRQFASKMK